MYTQAPPMAKYTPHAPPPLPIPEAPVNAAINVQSKLGQPIKKPIVENHREWAEGQTGKLKPNDLRFSNAVTPHSNNQKKLFPLIHV